MKDLVTVNLTLEDLKKEYRMESLSQTEKEIHKLLDFNVKSNAFYAFNMGMRLLAVKNSLAHGEFLPWLEKNFDLTDRTARKYITLYKHYKNEPASFLESKGLEELYARAGITQHDPYGSLFNEPTVSQVKLENYRFECPDGKSLWLVRRGIPVLEKVFELRIDRPKIPELKLAYEKLMRDCQCEMEKFFMHVEEKEKRETPPKTIKRRGKERH
jgi:hypothetical protein